jgi:hypothetical protein
MSGDLSTFGRLAYGIESSFVIIGGENGFFTRFAGAAASPVVAGVVLKHAARTVDTDAQLARTR